MLRDYIANHAFTCSKMFPLPIVLDVPLEHPSTGGGGEFPCPTGFMGQSPIAQIFYGQSSIRHLFLHFLPSFLCVYLGKIQSLISYKKSVTPHNNQIFHLTTAGLSSIQSLTYQYNLSPPTNIISHLLPIQSNLSPSTNLI